MIIPGSRKIITRGCPIPNLYEGLLTSYDFDKCKKYLLKKFDNIHSIEPIKIHPLSGARIPVDAPKTMYMVSIRTDFSNYKNLEKTLNNLCGWYISKAEMTYKDLSGPYPFPYILGFDNTEYGFLTEPNYKDENHKQEFLDTLISNEDELNIKIYKIDFICQEKFTDKTEIPEVLYHGTQLKFINKIRKIGLIPKNLNNHPERIYFSDSRRVIMELYNYEKPFVFLRINVPENIKEEFYIDYNHDCSYFIYECIHPKYIDVMTNDGWKQLLDVSNDEIKIQNIIR